MSVTTAPEDGLTVRGGLRLALGTLIALPTTMTFLALSVAVLLGRSVAALGAHRLARAAAGGRR